MGDTFSDLPTEVPPEADLDRDSHLGRMFHTSIDGRTPFRRHPLNLATRADGPGVVDSRLFGTDEFPLYLTIAGELAPGTFGLDPSLRAKAGDASSTYAIAYSIDKWVLESELFPRGDIICGVVPLKDGSVVLNAKVRLAEVRRNERFDMAVVDFVIDRMRRVEAPVLRVDCDDQQFERVLAELGFTPVATAPTEIERARSALTGRYLPDLPPRLAFEIDATAAAHLRWDSVSITVDEREQPSSDDVAR